MSIGLAKGGNVLLTGQDSSLRRVSVGLGWQDPGGASYDLDASALMVGADGKVLSDDHFVFYGQPASPEGALLHGGDERQGGSGEGDDESIDVDLSLLPEMCTSVVFVVSIHDADVRGQSFGQVRQAYIRVVDADSQQELTRYDLAEDASTETAMIFGELYRRGEDWKFRAIGQGYTTGLRGIALDYGVDVAD